ncbi:Uma2 family endonuclease [Actinomadura logoneensis]|uniref:Uma2 family endonuclease n=1 Tax=Actinomadura logoneensis TaxID=2293572 RepID=A0A372JMX7_9ACTN|nr:Uma2 family endonuclease [Actinomadura logoneensis]RFU41383.1 Uma2 family endonuclease [Actinomadura logoneensis]
MTQPAWAPDPSSLLISEEQYEALPADVAHTIEVVEGNAFFCQPPSPERRVVAFRLQTALMEAKPCEPCIQVFQDTDMKYAFVNPHITDERKRFTLRRPDLSVLRCIERGSKLTSADVLVAVEITSTNEDTDFVDKKAEYAFQRIPAFLIVVMENTRIHSVEEYRLNWPARAYRLAKVHRGALTTELPEGIKLDVPFSTLEEM